MSTYSYMYEYILIYSYIYEYYSIRPSNILDGRC